MGEVLGPGYRLIEARTRIRRAVLAVDLAEMDTPPLTSFAGSDAARKVYGELADAARHLVLAQNAFDDYCEERAIRRLPSPAAGPGDSDG